jgi:hypothetical protein
MLGFETRVSLEEGLRRLVDWWREDRPQCLAEANRA